MSSPSEGQYRQLLILDTGPIRELVLFYAVDQFRFERLRPELRFLLDREDYQKCSKFVASFRRKTTSASVAAELHHWIRETDRTGRTKLWESVYEEFQNMGMDEEVVKLLHMDISLVTKYGPVDTSLLELARRNHRSNPLILTVDDALAAECKRAKISASLLREVVSEGVH